MTDRCFHCNEPLLGSTLTARVNDCERPVCCAGCLAVAELIAGSDLGDYYRFRESFGTRPADTAPATDRWAALDAAEVAAQFARRTADSDEVTLGIDGLRCGACGWLIDRILQSTPGILEASTSTATGRTYVRWRHAETSLGEIARTIARLGYRPHPLTPDAAIEQPQAERRDALKRLAVAGFGMMQVMMFAVADYSAELGGEVLDSGLREFFRIVSLWISTPVLFYSAAPVFAAAARSVRSRTIGMDVPVALALALAYTASVWNTFSDPAATVYFDSVTMFVFFLTLSRFVQMSVRHRTISITDALARQVPAHARRIDADGPKDVAIGVLRNGDLVLVRPGEVLPADGELLDAEALLSEAILTGEALPQRRRRGDRVLAGSLNVGEALRFSVSAPVDATMLSHIVALVRRAQSQRPKGTSLAEVSGSRFLRHALIGAGLTCILWLILDPARAFEVTLSVLVVACPCAFAIAMPAATAAGTAHLARLGLLVMRIGALEALARIDRIVFDKTGTLTKGDLTLERCIATGELSSLECTDIAAALEAVCAHPIGRAFASTPTQRVATDLRSFSGQGIEGSIDGRRYRIGTPSFVAGLRNAPNETSTGNAPGTLVLLGDERQELARFQLLDTLRSSAASTVAALSGMQIEPQILSGDGEEAVAAVARMCEIHTHLSRQSPDQKLTRVRRMHEDGHRVAMVGDGVNDAPVLASADVSIAMGRGAALAHASADAVLVNEDLGSLPRAIRIARKAQRIARQNLIWSAVYNFGSLPLAAAGLVPPWLAALGMSVSSVAVVLNAARLLPGRQEREAHRPIRGEARGRTAMPQAQGATS
jgi:Cu2+-exporting ATPase